MVPMAYSGVNNVEQLLSVFRGHDGALRLKARTTLSEMGKSVVPHLLIHLNDKNDSVRWEIAKLLEELSVPSTASALVKLLSDENPDIRWLAGEGLIHLKQEALVPLLRGLQVNFHSMEFREGTHHVLNSLRHDGLLQASGEEVLSALEGSFPGLSVPFVAAKALRAIKSNMNSGKKHRS